MFWRKAADSAERQRLFLAQLLRQDQVIALVYEQAGVIEGVIIGSLIAAPPVYDPGGLTCSIDDFVVSGDWSRIGAPLLEAVMR